ncbi:histidine phosphatase family protein [Pseudomonas sp. Irchel 3H3]|uniref:histidine phosphatase family protein n=1 Tax=Pseudomonas sp. Irchel 3H3 TaxID=2009038 RepID=UPI000BA365F2|nr:histidine phosphatase family protein [Pseudomonas sp. Irchel 3H3]
MLTVTWIRHGESAANAGGASSDPALIPLTERGRAQAQAIAESIEAAPDLIVMSPFTRAQDTAAPTLRKFPATPVQVWPVEEFTYLSPADCMNTTAAQRRPWVQAYWQAGEPDHSNGPGTESFHGLVLRAQTALRQLQGRTGSVLVFGHGQFMQVVRWLILLAPQRIDAAAMGSFHAYDQVNPIVNGEAVCFTFDGQRWSSAGVFCRSELARDGLQR